MNFYIIICNLFCIFSIYCESLSIKIIASIILILNTIKPIYIIYNQEKFKYNVKKRIKQKQFQQQSKSNIQNSA